MRLQLLIDMNLSPQWVPVLQKHERLAVHWSSIGDPRASDREIMDWARNNQHVVFTHDLDFGAMLAFSHDSGPSVLQVRAEDHLPDSINTKPTCPMEPWSWLTKAEAGFECCRYETPRHTSPPGLLNA